MQLLEQTFLEDKRLFSHQLPLRHILGLRIFPSRIISPPLHCNPNVQQQLLLGSFLPFNIDICRTEFSQCSSPFVFSQSLSASHRPLNGLTHEHVNKKNEVFHSFECLLVGGVAIPKTCLVLQ